MDEAAAAAERKKRKEEGRRKKREKIAQSGGKRPRQQPPETTSDAAPSPTKTPSSASLEGGGRHRRKRQNSSNNNSGSTYHQFGRVMQSVPCRNKPRSWTVSIALPGSVVSNCQTKELRTQLVGQIARAATIYHVDEIVVYDDKLSKNFKSHHFGASRRRRDEHHHENHQETTTTTEGEERRSPPFDPHAFMAKVLQYCECPQYLRRHFFPMHPDLQFAGLLSPIDAPHHVRAEDRCKYREGVVLDKLGPHKGSLVNCGIRGRPVEIDTALKAGVRCTVQLETSSYHEQGKIRGKVVSPSAPREENGTYWGYTVRMADSLKSALEQSPFENGYDLKIGTSERGTDNLDHHTFSLPSYQHALIVFGGVAGIEECVDADESFQLPGSQSRKLFDMWVNICPYQASRTIRTEEAVLIAMAKMSPHLVAAAAAGEAVETSSGKSKTQSTTDNKPPEPIHFSDAPSEESSESEDDGSSD